MDVDHSHLLERPAGTSLSRDQYVSNEWFDRDMDRVFYRHWLYAGHISQLKAGGDFFLREVGDESLIVVRDEDGRVQAHFNVCRHRGARFCEEDEGSAARFRCPYHQWTYGLDGSLVRAPNMDASFDPDLWPLHRAHAEVWNGLIFINLSEANPEPVSSIMARAHGEAARFEIEHCKVAHEIRYDVPANWKLVLENYYECYHCPACHPEFCAPVDVQTLFTSDHSSIADGLDHPYERYGSLPMKTEAKTLSVSGEFVCSKLLGKFANGAPPRVVGVGLRPAMSVVMCADYGIVFDFQPVAPMATRVRCQWLVSSEAEEGRDYRVDELIRLWDATNRQDWRLCEITQQGVRSRRYVPGPHSAEREPGVDRFLEIYFQMLEQGGSGGVAAHRSIDSERQGLRSPRDQDHA